jgi:hypothetical protein
VAAAWTKLHNEELHNLHSSPDIIRITKSRKIRWVGHVARIRRERNAHTILIVKPEENRPLGRHRRRLKDNINTDLVEIGLVCVDWIHPAQDRGRWWTFVPSGSIKGGEFLD